VGGQRVFRRDETGLIRREDALEVAKQQIGAPVVSAEAKLVRNEGGFLDWWVQAEAKAAPRPVRKAFFISPYTGAVRAEAKPQVPPVAVASEKTKSSQ